MRVEFIGYGGHLRKRIDELLAANADLAAERDLFEQERDTALYELEREQRAHEFHHGKESR